MFDCGFGLRDRLELRLFCWVRSYWLCCMYSILCRISIRNPFSCLSHKERLCGAIFAFKSFLCCKSGCGDSTSWSFKSTKSTMSLYLESINHSWFTHWINFSLLPVLLCDDHYVVYTLVILGLFYLWFYCSFTEVILTPRQISYICPVSFIILSFCTLPTPGIVLISSLPHA